MRTTNRPPIQNILAAVLVIGLATGLSACVTDSTGDRDTTASAAAGLGARWGACMRSAGFDIDDPSDAQVRSGTVTSPQSVDQERFGTAADSCSAELGVERADSAAKEQWKREYAMVGSCVREAYPDLPEQEPGTLSFDPETYPFVREPAFQDRLDSCLQQYSPDTEMQDAK